MRIVTNTIYQIGGYPGDFATVPSYIDIYMAHGFICMFLSKEGYLFRDLVNNLRPQVSSETYFDPKRIIFVESRARFPFQKNNSVLEVMIATRPEELEGIVFAVRESSGLPIGSWKDSDPVEHEVSDDFDFLKYNNFASLKNGLGANSAVNSTDTAIIRSNSVIPK